MQLVAQMREYIPESGALASLDTAKAFDSVDWRSLQATLGKFGFGNGFKQRVKILYANPRSK